MLFMSADYIKMDSGLLYDGSKHNESRTVCNSCNGLTLLERKISTSASALETEIIFNLLSLTADIKENHFAPADGPGERQSKCKRTQFRILT